MIQQLRSGVINLASAGISTTKVKVYLPICTFFPYYITSFPNFKT